MAINWGGLLDPTTREGMAAAGLFGGLQSMGAALMQAGAPRPLGQPGPTLGDAFGAFGQGQQQGYARAKAQRDAMGMAAWDEAFSPNADPTKLSVTAAALRNSVPENMRAVFGALPTDMRAQVMGQLLTRKTNPKDRYGAVGRFVVDYSGEKPVIAAEMPDTVSAARHAQDLETSAARASRTTVNLPPNIQVGSIPQDYQLVRDGDKVRLEVIPGSKTARELEDKAKKETAAQAKTESQADLVVQDIDRALETLATSRLPVTGFGAETMMNIGGSSATNVKRLMDSVKARIGFNELNTMRQNSPTGAALGSVQVQELHMLQAVLGSLEQDQSPAQFRDNLARARNMFLDIVHGPGNGPPRLPLGFQQPGPGGVGIAEPPAPPATPSYPGFSIKRVK